MYVALLAEWLNYTLARCSLILQRLLLPLARLYWLALLLRRPGASLILQRLLLQLGDLYWLAHVCAARVLLLDKIIEGSCFDVLVTLNYIRLDYVVEKYKFKLLFF
jgi:hypothetical protein